MDDIYEILETAAGRVRDEQRAVRSECDAFCEFRDSIPQTVTRASETGTAGIEPADIRKLYRETVLATTDYERAHGDFLEESIEAEFPAAVVTALLSDAMMSPRLKRKLLVAANESLEQRNRFEETLEQELTSLELVRDELLGILSDIRSLPIFSLEETSFEEFSEAWMASETLLERCEQLVSDRQQHLATVNGSLVAIDDPHALNGYLYSDLETIYPALYAITNTRRCIERYQAGNEAEGDFLGPSVEHSTDPASASCYTP